MADLYSLEYEKVVNLERFGEKSAQNLIDSIEHSKQVPFQRVLYALGIRYVGETVAKKLAEAFKNLDNLVSADQQALEEVDEIGERIAQSVIAYLEDPLNQTLIHRLKESGLQFKLVEESISKSHALDGKSFVISGVFQNHSRDELKNLIEQHGGRNSASISSKTDYVVAGANMGPSKYEKAQELGVPIITEEEFIAMLS